MTKYQSIYTGSHALIIGINSYTDPRFVPLGQAEADAKAVALLLAEPPFMFNVRLLLGKDATKQTILQNLFELRSTDADDRVLVYFAGHGYTLIDRFGVETGYLAAVDTAPEQDFTALGLSEVLDLRRHAPAKHIGFIFDACFSGQALGLTRAQSGSADKFMERRSYQVLSAGAGDQAVSDSRSMTGLMIQAFQSGVIGDDGIYAFGELGLYLQQTMAADSGHTQIPQFGHIQGSQGGDFIFYREADSLLPRGLEAIIRSGPEYKRLTAMVELQDIARGPDAAAAAFARKRIYELATNDPSARVKKEAQEFLDEEAAAGRPYNPAEGEALPRLVPAAISQSRAINVLEKIADSTRKERSAVAVSTPPRKAEKPTPAGKLPLPLVGGAVGLVALGVVITLLVTGVFGGGRQTPTPEPTSPPEDVAIVSEVAESSPTVGPTATEIPAPTATIEASPVPASVPTEVAGPTPYGGGQGRLAYAAQFGGTLDLYVANADGTGATNLTNTPGATEYYPAWSPDGTRLAFVSNRTGNNEIFFMDIATGVMTQLTQNPNDDVEPAWSPDGARILFSSFVVSDYELYTIAVEGAAGEAFQLTNTGGDEHEASYTPDGTRVVYAYYGSGEPEIYLLTLSGGDPVNLTNNAGRDTEPVLSPDGSHIAFRSNRDGNSEVYVMNINGGNLVRLTSHIANDFYPAWSPDGSLIAWISFRTGSAVIYLSDPAGQNKAFISGLVPNDSHMAWQP